MIDTFPFLGRGRHIAIQSEPDAIRAESGHVLCLVVTVAGIEFVSYYCRLAVIDPWGLRLVNPFQRLSLSNFKHEFSLYLPKDLHVFGPARLDLIPEQNWMLREC